MAGAVRDSETDTATSDIGTAPRPPRLGTAYTLAPGLAFCGVFTAIAIAVNHLLPAVSPLLVAIVIGAVVTNIVKIPEYLQPGIQFSAKRLLRIGVALLGCQLVFGDILGLGWGIIVVVFAIVFLGIGGSMLAGKLLGLSWTQRLLIACGFSICGAAAVAAVDGVVEAEEQEVVAGVALVVIFGTLMIPIIPLLARAIGLDDRGAGIWAGGAVHEVAQVVATGGAIGGAALAVAVVVKLARVLLLAPVMMVLSVQRRRRAGNDVQVRRPPLIPLFVLAFIACVVLRSTGALPTGLLDGAKTLQTVLLTAAMLALGTGVRASTLAKVGARPFVLALIATVWVALIALIGVQLAG